MKLTEQERQYLIERIQKGEDIPLDFKYKLFPTLQKEYELVYAGKMRKEDILADEDGVTAVPLQIEKVFNGERDLFDDGWRNMIVFGDNLQFLKTIYKNEDPLIKDKVKGKVKLIYIDPPFATDGDFKGSQGQKAYSDKSKDADFIEFLRRRLIVARELMSEDGSIFIHLDQKKVHYVKICLDEIFLENNFKSEIIWKRKTGTANSTSTFGNQTDYLLYFGKTSLSKYTRQFRKDGVPEEVIKKKFSKLDEDGKEYWSGDLGSPNLRENLRYDYKGYKPPKNGWAVSLEVMMQMDSENRLIFPKSKTGRIRRKMFLEDWQGFEIQNLWDDISPIQPNSIEKVDYPTQKPESLLQRVIEATTNENDLILDFFSGSGTTAAVAEKFNRKWIVCDIGKLAFYTIQKRILSIENTKNLDSQRKEYGKKAKSFITVNTGLYDLPKLFQLQKEEYIRFVLNLFEVTPQKRTINGICVQGERKDGYNVLVWEYWNYEDAAVDEIFLEHLHEAIGKRLGDRLYIIAPANKVQFIDDYYQLDLVRYYFLKVPYQIIQELHKAKFKKFRQPTSKNNVNALEDAIGFHFIRQPEVKSAFNNGVLTINEFAAHYPDEDTGSDIPGFQALAMIVVDKNYDGKEFVMSEAFFAEDLLTKESDKINIKINSYGERIGVVYVDIYGNEFREEIKTKL